MVSSLSSSLYKLSLSFHLPLALILSSSRLLQTNWNSYAYGTSGTWFVFGSANIFIKIPSEKSLPVWSLLKMCDLLHNWNFALNRGQRDIDRGKTASTCMWEWFTKGIWTPQQTEGKCIIQYNSIECKLLFTRNGLTTEKSWYFTGANLCPFMVINTAQFFLSSFCIFQIELYSCPRCSLELYERSFESWPGFYSSNSTSITNLFNQQWVLFSASGRWTLLTNIDWLLLN